MTLLLRYWWMGAIAALLIAVYALGHSHGADSVQAKWDAQRLETAKASTEYFVKLNDAIQKAQSETEVLRANYIEYKAGKERETSDLERAVADGSKRLRVAATCRNSGMPADAAVPGGTGSGSAELDAAARPTYYALQRGINEQRGLLNFCRAELRKRSK